MALHEEVKLSQASKLIELIEYFGGRKQTEQALSVSKQTLFNWIKRGRISATKAIEVERLTGGAIKKTDLRPDVMEWVE